MMNDYGLNSEELVEAVQTYKEYRGLEPFQAELVKLQQHIDRHKLKLIILFEGRDAAGKGSDLATLIRTQK